VGDPDGPLLGIEEAAAVIELGAELVGDSPEVSLRVAEN